jgi:hypothetical protein
MKKVMAVILTLAVVFSGCSSKNNIKSLSDPKAESSTLAEAAPSKSDNSIEKNSSNNENTTAETSSTSQIQPFKNETTKTSSAAEGKSPFEKGYYDYQGTIGNNISIQATIYPLGQEIVGSYYYESQRKEMKLKGKAGDSDLVLYEYDASGKNTGIFKGTVKSVDKIEGTWVSSDNKFSYPFSLTLKSIIPGAEYGKRYEVAVGSISDQEVENYASRIQSYIINDNKEQLSSEINYPIKVKINNKLTTIQDKESFIRNYDLIFHSKYKQDMTNASNKYMFAKASGIMFGTGSYNLWINAVIKNNTSKLMVIAINN